MIDNDSIVSLLTKLLSRDNFQRPVTREARPREPARGPSAPSDLIKQRREANEKRVNRGANHGESIGRDFISTCDRPQEKNPSE